MLLIGFIISIIIFLRKTKKSKKEENNINKKSKARLLISIILTTILILIFVYFFRKINDNKSLVNEIIPELITLYDDGKISEVFLKTKSLLKDYRVCGKWNR